MISSQRLAVQVVRFPDGIAVRGEFPNADVMAAITGAAPLVPLVVADPPYGNIVKEEWDTTDMDDLTFARQMVDWTKKLELISYPGAALYVFGGIGKPRDGKNLVPSLGN